MEESMKASKKLIGAIASLAVAASLTVGTTFAWFSSQSSVSTENIEMNVTSGSDALQVAVLAKDGVESDVNFKYVLSADEVKTAMGAVTYTALTSADDGKTITEKGGAAATGGYAEFKFVFRTTMENAKLILSDTAAVTASDSSSAEPVIWEEKKGSAEYGALIGDNGEINAKAAHAARVAFIVDTNAKVWAPFEEYTVDASKTSDVAAGYYKGNLASDYNKFLNPALSAVTAQTMLNRVYRAKDAATNDAVNVVAAFPTTKAGDFYQLTVTVKIWLEGTDGDCLDAILKDTFGVAFGFRAAKIS